jgi:hypothetical protein
MFWFKFSDQNFYTFVISTMRATLLTYLVLHDLIILMKFLIKLKICTKFGMNILPLEATQTSYFVIF